MNDPICKNPIFPILNIPVSELPAQHCPDGEVVLFVVIILSYEQIKVSAEWKKMDSGQRKKPDEFI